MAGMVDLELKKAFQELQMKMIDTTRRLKIADSQTESIKKICQHATLTQREISSFPPDTRMFQGVGRMFMLVSQDEMIKSLDQRLKLSEEKIKSLEANKAYLESSLRDAENNLREMVMQKKNSA